MSLQIHGKQIDIGAALREHTQDRVSALVGKYFDRGSSGAITYSREGNNIRCDGLMHLASGMTLRTTGLAVEAYAALDQTLDHMETRLKRYLSRLKRHHKERGEPVESVTAPDYVIKEPEDTEAGTLEPVIVAELTVDVKFLTVGEAVMQMSLIEAPALMFRNRGTGRLNLVYRRSDGHIGWVDPPEARRS